MTKLSIYTRGGTKKTARLNLARILGGKENMALLAQAIRVYEWRSHKGLSKTKTRGEVSLTTKKAYRQKGTGYARHGAKSAPIFVGGGTAHGPKGVKKNLDLSKKMRRSALSSAVVVKAREGQMFAVEGLGLLRKTKEARGLIEKITRKEKFKSRSPRFTVALSDRNNNARRVFGNLKNVSAVLFKNLNAYKVYYGGTLLVDKEVLSESKSEADHRPKNTGGGSSRTIKITKTREVDRSIQKTQRNIR